MLTDTNRRLRTLEPTSNGDLREVHPGWDMRWDMRWDTRFTLRLLVFRNKIGWDMRWDRMGHALGQAGTCSVMTYLGSVTDTGKQLL